MCIILKFNAEQENNNVDFKKASPRNSHYIFHMVYGDNIGLIHTAFLEKSTSMFVGGRPVKGGVS